MYHQLAVAVRAVTEVGVRIRDLLQPCPFPSGQEAFWHRLGAHIGTTPVSAVNNVCRFGILDTWSHLKLSGEQALPSLV